MGCRQSTVPILLDTDHCDAMSLYNKKMEDIWLSSDSESDSSDSSENESSLFVHRPALVERGRRNKSTQLFGGHQ